MVYVRRAQRQAQFIRLCERRERGQQGARVRASAQGDDEPGRFIG
jgi:hypothetical protein